MIYPNWILPFLAAGALIDLYNLIWVNASFQLVNELEGAAKGTMPARRGLFIESCSAFILGMGSLIALFILTIENGLVNPAFALLVVGAIYHLMTRRCHKKMVIPNVIVSRFVQLVSVSLWIYLFATL
jgi:hypothetical protein